MVSAIRALAGFVSDLPADRSPERTDGREPYIHLCSMSGDVASAEAHIILRGFTDADMAENRRILDEILARHQVLNPSARWHAEYKNISNMAEGTERTSPHTDVSGRGGSSFRCRAILKPIRGGTDGSRLTEKGFRPQHFYRWE